jgi:hypothetical protein
MDDSNQAKVIITINYGYDNHSIEILKKDYELFKQGGTLSLFGQGFFHEVDGEQCDYWNFDGKTGEISFSLENDADFFAQDRWGAEK